MKEPNEEVVQKASKHYIDFDLTVKDVISRIKTDFPQSFKDCEESDFVKKSRTFVDSLVTLPDKLTQVLQTVPSSCKYCDHELHDWNYKEAIQYHSLLPYCD